MPKKASDRVVLVVESDSHAGHKLGLMAPDVTLYDEDEFGNPVPYTPSQTATQKYLWALRQEFIERTVEIARGAPIVLLHNGDSTQGNRFAEQLVTTSIVNQIRIAVANFAPWLALPKLKAIRIVQGTQVHEFGESTTPTLLTEMLKPKAPKVDIGMVNHGLLTVGGVCVDYAHHGPGPGGREWLRGNVARFYLRDLMISEMAAGQQAPDLVFRSHYHTYVKETVSFGGKESTIIITPSYCGLGDHARKALASPHRIGNGHIVVEIEGGSVQKIHALQNVVDFRTKEAL